MGLKIPLIRFAQSMTVFRTTVKSKAESFPCIRVRTSWKILSSRSIRCQHKDIHLTSVLRTCFTCQIRITDVFFGKYAADIHISWASFMHWVDDDSSIRMMSYEVVWVWCPISRKWSSATGSYRLHQPMTNTVAMRICPFCKILAIGVDKTFRSQFIVIHFLRRDGSYNWIKTWFRKHQQSFMIHEVNCWILPFIAI